MNDADNLVKIIKDLQRRVERLERRPNGLTMRQIIDTLYPVGSIYVTYRSSPGPAGFLGGNWAIVHSYSGTFYMWLRTS